MKEIDKSMLEKREEIQEKNSEIEKLQEKLDAMMQKYEECSRALKLSEETLVCLCEDYSAFEKRPIEDKFDPEGIEYEEVLQRQIDMMGEEQRQLQLRNQDLEMQLEAILHSRCWKLTKPIRVILNWVKMSKLGSLAYKTVHSVRVNGLRATLSKISSCLKTSKSEIVQIEEATNISFEGFVTYAKEHGAVVELPDVIASYDQKESGRKILFISHELDLTGAPIVLKNFAKSMMNQGDFPIFLSAMDGKLSNNVIQAGIPLVVYDEVYKNNFVRQFSKLFDVIVVNTIVGYPIVELLGDTDIPVLWWIHEAEYSYHAGILNALSYALPHNVKVYTVGRYAQEVLLHHRPEYDTESLLYYIADFPAEIKEKKVEKQKDIVTFAMIGTMQHRKGPDILVRAILLLPEDVLRKCRFLFIGRSVEDQIMKMIDVACKRSPDNVQYLGEMESDDLLELYPEIDCLICPSRDDPMPCTITEAMILSKGVICSQNTGYATIIEEMKSGFVYANDSPSLLAKEIVNIVKDPEVMVRISQQARKTYEKYFSRNVFEKNANKAIKDTIEYRYKPKKKSVSVVIPGYNAGEEGERLLDMLNQQKGLDELEIIWVDSGSKDGTPAMARAKGCRVIEIPQEEFSHSYARNLGAQATKGEYILFMTQDAMPMTFDWVDKMVSALQENGAVAASCREIPRPECDLYGRVNGWIHNDFMGILTQDRIMERPYPWSYEMARKNAQLNDVACIVKKSVFEKYGYRGDYAEDLDLGLRLIRDRYRLMALSSAAVVHSHTRPSFYHFRRAIVDTIALKRIMPEMPVQKVGYNQAFNQIFVSSISSLYYARKLEEHKDEIHSSADLRKKLHMIQKEIRSKSSQFSNEMVAKELEQGVSIDDSGILKVLQEILAEAPQLHYDPLALADITSFIEGNIISYFEYSRTCVVAEQVIELCDAIMKRLGLMIGMIIGQYAIMEPEGDNTLHRIIDKYARGV